MKTLFTFLIAGTLIFTGCTEETKTTNTAASQNTNSTETNNSQQPTDNPQQPTDNPPSPPPDESQHERITIAYSNAFVNECPNIHCKNWHASQLLHVNFGITAIFCLNLRARHDTLPPGG